MVFGWRLSPPTVGYATCIQPSIDVCWIHPRAQTLCVPLGSRQPTSNLPYAEMTRVRCRQLSALAHEARQLQLSVFIHPLLLGDIKSGLSDKPQAIFERSNSQNGLCSFFSHASPKHPVSRCRASSPGDEFSGVSLGTTRRNQLAALPALCAMNSSAVRSLFARLQGTHAATRFTSSSGPISARGIWCSMCHLPSSVSVVPQ